MMVIDPHHNYERRLWRQGYQFIAGLDEAGCGCWAGPVTAAAVILPKFFRAKGIRDSKTLSHKQKEKAYLYITHRAVSFGIGVIDAEEIDRVGLGQARQKALALAIDNLNPRPEFVLMDAFKVRLWKGEQQAIKGGDSRVLSIASASIIAKVVRDRIMKRAARDFPHYGFDRHVGYGTKFHQEMLAKHGPCKIHRLSYKPLKELIRRRQKKFAKTFA